MRERTIVRGGVLAALLMGVTACAEGGASPSRAVARDSAGIAIVESAGPAWSEATALAVAPEPSVAIGDETDPDYQFGRVSAATRLADGRLVVVDGMTAELRFYDAQGRFLARAGGKGGGPGEYQFVHWLRRLPGDTLLVHDLMAQRNTVLAPDGSVARTVNLAAAEGAAPAPPPSAEAGRSRMVFMGGARWRVIGPFADGSLLARSGGMPASPQDGAIQRDSVTYVRLAADGRLLDTLGTFAGDETVLHSGGSGQNRSIMIGPPPFGRTAQLAVDGDGFWFGSSDRYEIGRYDREGRLVRLVRRPLTPLPVTPDDVAERKRQDLEAAVPAGAAQQAAMFRRMAEQRWENAVIPPAMPAHGPLMTDAAGRLWVRETTRPADQVPRWSAFDAEGRLLGTVALPERFRPLEFGDGYVLGVQRDEDDVEQVALYPLRPAGR